LQLNGFRTGETIAASRRRGPLTARDWRCAAKCLGLRSDGIHPHPVLSDSHTHIQAHAAPARSGALSPAR